MHPNAATGMPIAVAAVAAEEGDAVGAGELVLSPAPDEELGSSMAGNVAV